MLKSFFLGVMFILQTTLMFSQNLLENNKIKFENQNAIQPFLFSVTTLTPDVSPWSINYSGSYGERVSGPFGYDGVGQQFAVKGYLGSKFTLYANASLGFPHDGEISSAQQAEVIRDVIGGKENFGFRFGVGLGVSRDYSSVFSTYSRLVATFEKPFWRLNGNVILEKAFEDNRDAIDVTTSIGFQYKVLEHFYAGVEALGEDLEGFWEEEEAEGGTKVLVGPSLNLAPNKSRFIFSLCGGPVIYATHSTIPVPSEAIRDLPVKNGFSLRAMIIFNLSPITKS